MFRLVLLFLCGLSAVTCLGQWSSIWRQNLPAAIHVYGDGSFLTENTKDIGSGKMVVNLARYPLAGGSPTWQTTAPLGEGGDITLYEDTFLTDGTLVQRGQFVPKGAVNMHSFVFACDPNGVVKWVRIFPDTDGIVVMADNPSAIIVVTNAVDQAPIARRLSAATGLDQWATTIPGGGEQPAPNSFTFLIAGSGGGNTLIDGRINKGPDDTNHQIVKLDDQTGAIQGLIRDHPGHTTGGYVDWQSILVDPTANKVILGGSQTDSDMRCYTITPFAFAWHYVKDADHGQAPFVNLFKDPAGGYVGLTYRTVPFGIGDGSQAWFVFVDENGAEKRTQTLGPEFSISAPYPYGGLRYRSTVQLQNGDLAFALSYADVLTQYRGGFGVYHLNTGILDLLDMNDVLQGRSTLLGTVSDNGDFVFHESYASFSQYLVRNISTSDDSFLIDENTPGRTLTILANDAVVPADCVMSIVTEPSHGTVSLDPNNNAIYRPGVNFHGSDSFRYRLSRLSGATQSESDVQLSVVRTVQSLTLVRDTLAGENNTLATVTLTSAANPTSESVTVSDNSTLIDVPSSVIVPVNKVSAGFRVSVHPVVSQTQRTVTVALHGLSKTVTITLVPLIPTALAFTPNPVVGGNSVQLRVVVNGVAGAGGKVVSLYDDSAYCVTPSTVTIPAGASSAFTTLTTSHPGKQQLCKITAAVTAGQVSAILRISP